MFILSEQARHSLKSAINKENIKDLTEHKFLSEAFEVVMLSKKETDFNAFTERCEWAAGTMIPGISTIAKSVLSNPHFSSMKIEICDDGKLLLDDVNITGNTKTFIMIYLVLILSVNDATTIGTETNNAPGDEDTLILVQQTIVLYKELMRLCQLYNTVYNFNMETIESFKQNVLMKNLGKGIAMPIATLAMLLLLDIDFCDSNATLILLLSRATKCLKPAMGSYLYTYICVAGEYLGANTTYLASAIGQAIARNQDLTLNTNTNE